MHDRDMQVVGDDEEIDDRTDARAMALAGTAAIQQVDALAQIQAARMFPRSVTKALREAIGIATFDEEIAAACMYALPRTDKDGKKISITGPSVRLAEIMASSWGNLAVGARIVEVGDETVTGEGVCWDVEKNVRTTVQIQRRIKGRSGRRFNDDMVVMTGNAAAAISYRNAVFKIIPRAIVQQVYNRAREVAVGTATTLAVKREKFLSRLLALGVSADRVFARLGVVGLDDVTIEHLEVLAGLGTAIKDGGTTVDEAFPEVEAATAAANAPEGTRLSLRTKKAPAADPPPSQAAAEGGGDGSARETPAPPPPEATVVCEPGPGPVADEDPERDAENAQVLHDLGVTYGKGNVTRALRGLAINPDKVLDYPDCAALLSTVAERLAVSRAAGEV